MSTKNIRNYLLGLDILKIKYYIYTTTDNYNYATNFV
jgi:hypothetical protein